MHDICHGGQEGVSIIGFENKKKAITRDSSEMFNEEILHDVGRGRLWERDVFYDTGHLRREAYQLKKNFIVLLAKERADSFTREQYANCIKDRTQRSLHDGGHGGRREFLMKVKAIAVWSQHVQERVYRRNHALRIIDTYVFSLKFLSFALEINYFLCHANLNCFSCTRATHRLWERGKYERKFSRYFLQRAFARLGKLQPALLYRDWSLKRKTFGKKSRKSL